MNTFGSDFDEMRDGTRLRRQMQHVLALMQGRSREWLSIEEICAELEAKHGIRFPVESVSADLRHLKKAMFGGHDIRRRKRFNEAKGMNENFSEYRWFPREVRTAQQIPLLAISEQDFREGVR